jgi:hypothetical protein
VVRVTQAANGSVLINGDDTVRYQPETGFTGTDGFTYTIADGHDGTATETVTVTVEDVRDDPVAEDRVVQTNEDTVIAMALRGSDADGDRLTFKIQQPPKKGSLAGTPPDIVYTPDVDYSGPDGFVFSVEDDDGGIDIGKVTISVNAVGDVPMGMP